MISLRYPLRGMRFEIRDHSTREEKRKSSHQGRFHRGRQGGEGVASCRMPDGTMSAPALYEIGGASVGFQIGGQTADLVLLIMNEGGVSRLLSGKFTLGGEP